MPDEERCIQARPLRTELSRGERRGREDRDLIIHTDDGTLDAERAASCLVPPGVGDEVAVVLTGDGRAFVIAVLVAADAETTEIAVPGDLRISAQGWCRIEGAEAVEVSSEDGAVSVDAKSILLRAVDGSIILSKLTMLASSVLAHTDGAQLAAKAVDWFCDRFSSTVKRSYRKVEEIEPASSVTHRLSDGERDVSSFAELPRWRERASQGGCGARSTSADH